MSDNHIAEDSFINSIIGEGTRFKGEFELNGLLRIDGDFAGTIRTNGKILIGRNGRVECTIHAGTVVIGGIIRGNVHATEKVIILSTGMMLGNINTPRLIAEEGVIFNGNCKIEASGEVEELSPQEDESDRDSFRPQDGGREESAESASLPEESVPVENEAK